MIQDIYPKTYNCEYSEKEPQNNSCVFFFYQNQVLASYQDNQLQIPFYDQIEDSVKQGLTLRYLFAIDETDYFLADTAQAFDIAPYQYHNISNLRGASPKDLSFAVATAYHLANWYRNNRYCGRCGALLQHDHQERMLRCDSCHNMVYPCIAPAVIVAVTNNDKILMTIYAEREYKRHALIAGFTEIGEAAEETVRREVMEESGLKVKNITYYKSQPWAFASNLLLGYFAELDGEDAITLDTMELAAADWFSRDEITEEEDGISLTREMIVAFKNGYVAGKAPGTT